MANNKNWVSNNQADEVVLAVQQSLLSKKSDPVAIQQMMDMIAGVENYSMEDRTRQGVIRRIFDSESSKYRTGRAYSTSNFSIDMDDVVATFWETVYNYLPSASVTGGAVAVRVVNGQQAETTINKGGQTFTSRSTNCNPIHYLRKMGIMGVRNLINSAYRRNLIQSCEDCGNSSSTSRVESADTSCPQCKDADTQVYWPEGSSSYRVKKERVCNKCKHTWARTFAYTCSECKSTNVRIESRYETSDDVTFQAPSEDESAENVLMKSEAERELDKVMKLVYNYLPTDPRDAQLISKTKEIFTILVDTKLITSNKFLSRDICRQCVLKAPKVCPEKCGAKGCLHILIPDPKISCGATTFALEQCVNFSKKIGEYHKCSASLTARRVKKVRQYFIRFVEQYKDEIDVCDSLYTLLESRGLLSQY